MSQEVGCSFSEVNTSQLAASQHSVHDGCFLSCIMVSTEHIVLSFPLIRQEPIEVHKKFPIEAVLVCNASILFVFIWYVQKVVNLKDCLHEDDSISTFV